MKTFEYSPLADAYVPYLLTPNLFRQPGRLQFLWEAMAYNRVPLLSRWVIYQALRGY